MTFENAFIVRESIIKYCIYRGVALKFVKNESADSDDNLLFFDYEEIPIERKHPARFNIED